jgi:ribose transport system permease protein
MTMARVLTKRSEIALALAATIVAFLIAVAVSPSFADGSNLRSLATQASFIGIVAIGQTMVILTGGVDLSVPWVMSSSALLLAQVAGGSDATLWWAVPAMIGYGAAIGLVNGVGVTVLGVSPIVMTLATNTLLSGTTGLITGSSLSRELPHGLASLDHRAAGPLPVDFVIWLVLAVVAVVVLGRSTFGRRLYATGANETVARFSGISVVRVRVAAYVVSGATAALAGLLLAGYSEQAFGNLGDPYLFASVAAVAIGGASILGGRGSYVGTVAGALFLTVLAAMLPILKLSSAWLSILYGVAILATVTAAQLRRARAST